VIAPAQVWTIASDGSGFATLQIVLNNTFSIFQHLCALLLKQMANGTQLKRSQCSLCKVPALAARGKCTFVTRPHREGWLPKQ
jgi:hypothetical protein